MHWIVLGIVGLMLVVSASRFPRLAFTLLSVLLVVAVITVQLNSKNDERSDSLISNSEVELSQVTLTSAYAGSYDMKGVLRNSSLASSIVEVVVQIAAHISFDRRLAERQANGKSTFSQRVERLRQALGDVHSGKEFLGLRLIGHLALVLVHVRCDPLVRLGDVLHV